MSLFSYRGCMAFSKGLTWAFVVAPVATFALGAFATYMLVEQQMGGSIAIIKGKGVVIKWPPKTDLSGLVGEAMKEQPKETERMLTGHDYYHLDSDQFLEKSLSKLSKVDLTQKTGQEIAQRLRRMLANLQGPFQSPGTLGHADEKFLKALDDLYEVTRKTDAVNAFVASLWKLSLERRGLFRQKAFPAKVKLLNVPVEKGEIFACPGSILNSSWVVDIFIGTNSVQGEVVQDAKQFDCERPVDVRQLLTGTVPVHFGLGPGLHRRLFSGPGESEPFFMVYPRDLVRRLGEQK